MEWMEEQLRKQLEFGVQLSPIELKRLEIRERTAQRKKEHIGRAPTLFTHANFREDFRKKNIGGVPAPGGSNSKTLSPLGASKTLDGEGRGSFFKGSDLEPGGALVRSILNRFAVI